MPANKDLTPRSEPYAAPAFYKHPPASSLPIPNFKECPSSVSNPSSESDKSSSESQSPIKENNEAQAEHETEENEASENLDLQKSQKPDIDDTEQKTAKALIRDGPQEMIDIQDRKSTIPANVHLKVQRRPHVAENLVVSERSTDHLLQLDYCKLPERDRVERLEILHQKHNNISEAVEENGAEFVGGEDVEENDGEDEAEDDEDSASSEQVEAEIDRYESDHREETFPSSLQVANFLDKYFERTEQTVVDDGSEADEGVAEESWEIEIFVASQTFEDEGYFSME